MSTQPRPPLLKAPPSRPPLPRWMPFLAGAAPWGAGLLAGAGLAGAVPWPVCLFKAMAQIPCPTCGSSRALAAWAQFQWAESLLYNPLAFLTCAILSLWALTAGLQLLVNVPLVDRLQQTLRHYRFRVPFLLGGLLLHWIYLCLTLP